MSYVDASNISRNPAFLDVLSVIINEKAINTPDTSPDAWYAAQVAKGGYNVLEYARACLVNPAVSATINTDQEPGPGNTLYGIPEGVLKAAVITTWNAYVKLIQVPTLQDMRKAAAQAIVDERMAAAAAARAEAAAGTPGAP